MFARAEDGDVFALASLERETSSEPWSEAAFSAFLKAENTVVLVCKKEKQLVGYISFRRASDYGEIANIAVKETHRRQGIARELCKEALEICKNSGVLQLTLEVRESNHAAKCLYESAGARIVGRRRRFYKHPSEDALVYSFDLA